MKKSDRNGSKEALETLIAKLNEKLSHGKNDFLVSYFDVSQAFPGGPLERYIDYRAIDFESLKQWANQNDWKVNTAPEETHENQQDTPWIRFMRKH